MHDFILCPYCGEDVLESETNCPHCNKDLLDVTLDVKCPKCGWDNPSGNKLCWFCREDLELAKKLDWLWENDKEVQKLDKAEIRFTTASIIAFAIFVISFILTCIAYAHTWGILYPCYYVLVFSCVTTVVCIRNKQHVNNNLESMLKEKLNALN